MRIMLRPITRDDGRLIVQWRNAAIVRSHCLNKYLVTIESNEKFFNENIITGKYIQFIVERIEEDYGVASYPIATVFLKDIDTYNKRCELCIFTSDDHEWNAESQSIAIKMLLDKAFDEYGMRKVYSYVFYKHIDESERLEGAGFTVEALLRKEALDEDGTPLDLIRFSIFDSDYKSIKNAVEK